MNVVRICEEYEGTRGSLYYYVVEGNKLRHISRYAIGENKHGRIVYWSVPIKNVSGKPIIELGFSGSGYGHASEYRIEDFIASKDGFPKSENRKWRESLKKAMERLRNYEFEIFDLELKKLIKEFKTLYVQMIDDVKKYSEKLVFKLSFVGHASRVRSAFDDVSRCLFACLSNPKDKSRLMSLRNVCRWIYQLWVLRLICEAVEAKSIKREKWQEKPCWWIEQGTPIPTCILETPYGDITCWFEFQFHEMAHWASVFTRKREHVRPDIVIVKGSYKVAKEVGSIDLIVECKERDFKMWKNEIKQVRAYAENFRPKSFILASLKQIPQHYKHLIEKTGIKVVDSLYPTKRDKIQKFTEIVRYSIF